VDRSTLYCKVCGGSLRITGSRCANRCCIYCHERYCEAPDHKLDLEKARTLHGVRLLALLRKEDPPPLADSSR
jgi:hypothetical protein